MDFKQIDITELDESFVKLISEEWALLSAGDESSYNTMTVSWGTLGTLWGKNVTFAFVRPQRYTFEFMNKSDYYTLSFYGDEMHHIHKICGSKSGREVDKAALCGLTPCFDKAPYFKEARLVLVCKKLAVQQLDPNSFIDKSINSNYKDHDYHHMFIGEIVKVLIKK